MIGPVELAAVGVSVSAFNLVSKLFNVPLLNVTTSFVAEEQALISKEKGNNGSSGICDGNNLFLDNVKIYLRNVRFAAIGGFNSCLLYLDCVNQPQGKTYLPAVSTSLALAAGVGIAEAVALFLGSGFLMNIMGITAVCLLIYEFCMRLFFVKK